ASAVAYRSTQLAMPRHFCMPTFLDFGSYTQRSSPVLGSSAIRRREVVHTTRLPSIRLGSSSKAISDPAVSAGGTSPVWYSQASARLATFSLLICCSGEYLAPN